MEEAALELFKPVIETATIIAAQYCKSCGRSTITSEDMKMGMRFAARRVPGVQNESMFPEIYEDSDEEEEEEEEEEDEEEWEEEPFTRYEGDDEQMKLVNEMSDTWDEWEPESPMQEMLKASIDKIIDVTQP
jgi:hypothetical protein